MKRLLAGVAVLFSVGIGIAAIQVAPPSNTGTIEGRIVRPDQSEGIPNVQITLQGPVPIFSTAELAAIYTPSPALTPDMRQQIDALIASAPFGISPETVAAAAGRLQAQLLGLPAPAPVVAAGPGVQPPQTGAQTDASGHFNFKNLAPGRYQVRAMRDGYFAPPPAGATIGIALPTAANSTATVLDGQPTPEIVMTMLRGGTVSGRVRDPGGQAVPGLQINAFQLSYQNGRKILQSINSKTTDDHGDYRLFWLPPGEYYIAVTPPRPRPAPGPQDGYVRTFFPGTINGREAQTVTVAEGGEVAAVDLGIRDGATTITGKVVTSLTGPNGAPSPVSTFYLMPADTAALNDSTLTSFANSAANRSDGQFEIRGVTPGVYDLMATTSDSAGHQGWGRTRVNVSSGATQDVTLKIEPGIDVKVHVTVDGAPPAFTMAAPPVARGGTIITIGGTVGGAVASLTGGTLTAPPPPQRGAASTDPPALVPTPALRLNWQSMEPYTDPALATASQNSTFDPSGVYDFPNVPGGRYIVQPAPFPLPPNAYVADVQIGGMSVYDSGFDAGSVTGTIDVNVNSNGAKITGTVLDAAKKPFVAARVVLVPPPARRQNLNLYKTAASDAMGNFTLTGIAPGDYKIFAWESVMTNAWMNAEFLDKYESSGENVTASAAATTKVEVKLIPR